MVDLGEDEEKFESFMSPITSKNWFCCYSETNAIKVHINPPILWWHYQQVGKVIKDTHVLRETLQDSLDRAVPF